jgi:hypothetical protein
MLEVTRERWESLRQRRAPSEFILERVDDASGDAMLGIEVNGRLHLLVAVTTEPSRLPPDLQSIEVRTLEEQGQIWLDVSARGHHEDLFTMLANKILHAIRIEGRDPAISVEKTIEDLRAALRPIAPELGATEQIGLFGELWALSNILIPTLSTRASLLWSGPERERHDFAGVGVHVEIKTTIRSESKHDISRLDQLRTPNGKRLLLVSVLLERSIAGEKTIADLIDEVLDKLRSDGRAIDVFENNLKSIGWHDDLRQSGALLRFSLRDAHVFEVEGSFPRLPDDYVPPRGVTGIRYTIDLAARASLGADQVREILATM